MTSKPTQTFADWSFDKMNYIETFTKAPFEDLHIQKLAGDASSRLYWRIRLKDQSWVLLERSPFKQEQDNLPYINVQNHLQAHHIGVPHIYSFSPELGFLFIEDFGDNSLERITQKLPPKKFAKYYFLALDELLKIHYDASTKKDSCIAFSLDFDQKKFKWELGVTQEFLFQKHCKVPIKGDEAKTLNHFFNLLSDHLANQPKVFTHRDYHSRNLIMVDSRVGVLDFQDARMGTCHYDLASLLKDSYVRLPNNLIDELIEYYVFEKEKLEKTKIDRKSFRNTFDWMSIQRNLKAMGTFAYLHIDKGKSNYLQYILPTYAYVDETLKKYPEFKKAHSLLDNIMQSFPEATS